MTKPRPGAKRGRPPTIGADGQLRIRAPSAWVERVKTAADAAGVTVADYVRAAVDARLRRKR